MRVGLIGDFSVRQSTTAHIATLPARVGVDVSDPGDVVGVDVLIWVRALATETDDGIPDVFTAARDAGIPTVAWCPIQPRTPPDTFGDLFVEADHVAVTIGPDPDWHTVTTLHLQPAVADTTCTVGRHRPHLPSGPVIVGDPTRARDIAAHIPDATVWPTGRWLGGQLLRDVAVTATTIIIADRPGPDTWSPWVPAILAAGGRVICTGDTALETAFDCDLGRYDTVTDIIELAAVAAAHPDTPADRAARISAVVDGGHTHVARFVEILEQLP